MRARRLGENEKAALADEYLFPDAVAEYADKERESEERRVNEFHKEFNGVSDIFLAS